VVVWDEVQTGKGDRLPVCLVCNRQQWARGSVNNNDHLALLVHRGAVYRSTVVCVCDKRAGPLLPNSSVKALKELKALIETH